MEIGEHWMAPANNVHNESNINDHDQAASGRGKSREN